MNLLNLETSILVSILSCFSGSWEGCSGVVVSGLATQQSDPGLIMMRAGITIFVYNENILSEVYLLPSAWFNTFISLFQSLVDVQSPDCTTA